MSKILRVLTTVLLAVCGLSNAIGQSGRGTSLRLPSDPFAPSNARTISGKTIPVTQFIPASRCRNCHADTHEAWAESLHRNAGREPFYKESVDLLTATRPIEFSRHCEGCHFPVSLLSGALKTGSKVPRSFDDEGVTCSVCHSIVGARLDGTGSYTIAPPALLVGEDGRAKRDATDSAILADIEGHKRAVMRPLLRSANFCATCHKSSVPPDLSGLAYFQKGFNVYDEWQVSAFAHETASSADARTPKPCQACHMPEVPSAHDYSAKGGKIKSHRWPGANTAVPLVYGAKAQFEITKALLESGIVSVRVAAVTRESAESRAPINSSATKQSRAVLPGQSIAIDVLVSNRAVGHSFPPELRDLYESWLDLQVIDDSGRVLARSGYLDADGNLDPDAHAYKQVLVDQEGKALGHHEMWLAMAKACDNRVGPGQTELIRYRLAASDAATTSSLGIRVALRYRRFNNGYASFVARQQKRVLENPIVTISSAAIDVKQAPGGIQLSGSDADQARQWNEYGMGLLAEASAEAASAFHNAGILDPAAMNYRISEAIAELRAEKTGPQEQYTERALALLDAVLAENPASPRANYWRAVAWNTRGEFDKAARALRLLSVQYPGDREVWRQYAIALTELGADKEAGLALSKIIQIDPIDPDAHLSLSFIQQRAGQSRRASQSFDNYYAYSRLPSQPLRGACDAGQKIIDVKPAHPGGEYEATLTLH